MEHLAHIFTPGTPESAVIAGLAGCWLCARCWFTARFWRKR